jgi:hypothetical protein
VYRLIPTASGHRVRCPLRAPHSMVFWCQMSTRRPDRSPVIGLHCDSRFAWLIKKIERRVRMWSDTVGLPYPLFAITRFWHRESARIFGISMPNSWLPELGWILPCSFSLSSGVSPFHYRYPCLLVRYEPATHHFLSCPLPKLLKLAICFRRVIERSLRSRWFSGMLYIRNRPYEPGLVSKTDR